MKWILFAMLTLCSFWAQADKCDFIPPDSINGEYTFTPNAMTGTLDGGLFAAGQNDTIVLSCNSTVNAWLKAVMAIIQSDKFAFRVGSKYYMISFSVDYQQQSQIPAKSKYTLSDFFDMAGLVLHYSIVEADSPGGAKVILPGAIIPLVTTLNLDYCQGNATNCALDKKINYTINFLMDLDITTCAFGDQEIDLGTININDLNKKPFELHPVQFTCQGSGSGSLKFTPDNVVFYFEPIGPLATDAVTLTNDYGTSSASAGAVGFQLSMDGTTSIGYGSSHPYTSSAVTGGTVPINIYARTRTYEGKVTAGEAMSRVKVVVDYH
ncbi:fimbrial protein [Citrobacter tructae]|uniref:fimbrial protein n=1 Tax=Citrobacter tructae TaxID=2562449 RepID=UPI003F56A651